MSLKNYFLKSMLLISLIVQITLISAQTVTPVIMAQINAELQKRGLTQNEVRTRLLQKGIDLENMPPTEVPKYQTQVMDILDELQAEKNNGKKEEKVNQGTTVIIPPANETNTSVATVEPVTTPQEAAAEASQRVIQADIKSENSKSIYGHSLFTDHSLDIFRTTDGAQAPETYVLGDGDEIRITIFGASQTDIQQKIALDGSIQPSGGAKIFLKGLTLTQAREVIRQRLSTSYTFRSDQLAVTIVSARTILVNVFGEARITGGFTISALNSALNALAVAGGPTEIGSVRTIQLIRGENRKTIDLYAFMNDPATQFRFDLQNNDILFVPVIKSLVTIQGAVNRPMAYEMLPNETLADLIRYAGNLKMNVFPDFVQIQRYINGEQRLLEFNLEDVRSGKIKVNLANGDSVVIKSIGKPMDQFVNIEGSVYYPGKYDLTSNPTLGSLMQNAKPNTHAKTDMLFVERVRPDETIEILSVPFPGSQEGAGDFTLQPRDKIRVLDQVSYRDVATISVNGQVRVPFEKSFSLNDRISVKQALEMAGGLKNSAYPAAYIFRRNLFNPVEIKYIRIELSQADNILLQAGDQLNIYDNTTYTNIGEIRVSGAVKKPLGLTYDPSLTISDALTNAGGVNIGAAFNRVEIFRTILSPTEKSKLDLITLQVDSNYRVLTPQNFTLQPYDQIVVRLTPEFTLGRVVEINGQVNYPGAYVLESRQVHLSEIIEMAGGLLNDADPLGSRLFRTYRNRGNICMNIQKAINFKGNLKYDPIVFEGDVININRLENVVVIKGIGTRMDQYSVDPNLTEIKNVIFQGHKSAAWYIRNFAGGFAKNADRNSITVTMPNDQMQSTKRFFLGFRSYPIVEPGSIITLRLKPPTDATLVEKKKVDWDAVFSRSASGLTSALTLYLLVDQLTQPNP